MKAGVVAAGGRLGGKITTEALDRGMEVTAIVRSTPCRDSRALTLKKDLFGLTREDIAGFDVLFSAFGSGFVADPAINYDAVMQLVKIAAGTGVHVVMIGGAGCLYADETGESYVCDGPDHPAFLKGISANLLRGYAQLEKITDVAWTFVCPSLLLDPDGPRTCDYLTRCDRHILFNEDGNSYVSYDDLAYAMTDFGEKGLFRNQLVTVASRRGGAQ